MPRRAGLVAALAAVLAVGPAVLPGVDLPGIDLPGAAADEGLAESSRSRYVLEADASEVRATVTTTIRNTTPSSGGYVYYYDRYGIPVPAGAEDVRAASGGSSLPVTVTATEDPSTALATASFSALYHGRSRTIEWSFTIPGEPVRSKDRTRVGPGYATFAVQATGDPGQTSVDVVVPSAMTFDTTGDAFTPSKDGRTTTYRATEATDEHGIWAVVSARDPEQVETREVTVGDATVTLRAFPGDRRWLRFVAAQVERGLPALEDVVGEPWPGGLRTIREDVSPQALGYAWFDAQADEIVVPEDLDAALLYHELSHAWLHPDRLGGRWLYEGLAETVAYRVLDRTGARGSDPRETPDRDDDAALPLTSWREGEPSAETEDYAYAASYTAVRRLLGDLDDETFAQVVAAALAGESAYEPAGSLEHNQARTDWRRFLDLAEVRGGVEHGAKTYRTWVVDGDQRRLLADRADARDRYTALDDTDGAWLPPLGVRTSMTGWEFADAVDAVKSLGAAAEEAGAVQEAARSAGLTVPDAVRAAYEDASSAAEYRELASTLPRATGALTAVGDAVEEADRERDPVSRLGAVVLRLDAGARASRQELAAGDLAAATTRAEAVTDRAGWATGAGAGSLLAAAAALAALGALARRSARRRGARATAAQAPEPGPGPAAPAGDDADATTPGTSQGTDQGTGRDTDQGTDQGTGQDTGRHEDEETGRDTDPDGVPR